MVLVVDNYDSFTWNLVQLIGELGGEPLVKRNDELSVDDVRRLAPSHIVISPGPCTPAEAGISVDVVRLGEQIPLLGVCLGHQSIGAAYGARIVRARRPMHGKVSEIRHHADGLFAGLDSPLRVARYHSLVIEPGSMPAELVACAWSANEEGADEEIQAVRHRSHPIWGVQFHPESVASEGGKQLMSNFLNA